MLRVFAKREDGAATIEALLWIPLMLFFFSLLADAAMIFTSQAQVLRIVQDGNRKFAIGFYETTNEVEDYVEATIANLTPNATAVTETSVGAIVRTTVTMPASDVIISGLMDSFLDLDVTVTSFHLMEDQS
ncbi:MAG: hypothetical protein HKN63_02155 [Rhodobacteraceae bacterium]|nr:hypothetical protein [Paracoccaceae bacterium]